MGEVIQFPRDRWQHGKHRDNPYMEKEWARYMKLITALDIKYTQFPSIVDVDSKEVA